MGGGGGREGPRRPRDAHGFRKPEARAGRHEGPEALSMAQEAPRGWFCNRSAGAFSRGFMAELTHDLSALARVNRERIVESVQQ